MRVEVANMALSCFAVLPCLVLSQIVSAAPVASTVEIAPGVNMPTVNCGGTSGKHQRRPGELPVAATHTGGDECNEDGGCEDSGEPEEQSAAVSSPCKNASLPVELHSLGQQLGSYATPEDAAVAYRQELEAECAREKLSLWDPRVRRGPHFEPPCCALYLPRS